jgi:hypothetical protein
MKAPRRHEPHVMGLTARELKTTSFDEKLLMRSRIGEKRMHPANTVSGTFSTDFAGQALSSRGASRRELRAQPC